MGSVSSFLGWTAETQSGEVTCSDCESKVKSGRFGTSSVGEEVVGGDCLIPGADAPPHHLGEGGEQTSAGCRPRGVGSSMSQLQSSSLPSLFLRMVKRPRCDWGPLFSEPPVSVARLFL